MKTITCVFMSRQSAHSTKNIIFDWICESVDIKDIKTISDIQNDQFMRIPILQDVYVKLSQIF